MKEHLTRQSPSPDNSKVRTLLPIDFRLGQARRMSVSLPSASVAAPIWRVSSDRCPIDTNPLVSEGWVPILELQVYRLNRGSWRRCTP